MPTSLEHYLVQRGRIKIVTKSEVVIARSRTSEDIASYRSENMNMARVYLKGGKTFEVPLEELEDYLYANADKIEQRHVKQRRPHMNKTLDDVVIFN